MLATTAPQQPATSASRRSGFLSKLRERAVIGSRVHWSDGANQDARPLYQRHHIKQYDQRSERERDGNRAGTLCALLCFGEHNAVVVALLVHDDPNAHVAKRTISPPHPRSTSNTANSRNRYRIEKAKRLRLERSAGRRSRRTCQPSATITAPTATAVIPYSAPV